MLGQTGNTFLFFPRCVYYKIRNGELLTNKRQHPNGIRCTPTAWMLFIASGLHVLTNGQVLRILSWQSSAISLPCTGTWARRHECTRFMSSVQQPDCFKAPAGESKEFTNMKEHTHTCMHTGGCKSEKNTGEIMDPMGEMDSSSPSLRRPIAHRRADYDFDVSFSWTHLRFDLWTKTNMRNVFHIYKIPQIGRTTQ